MKEPSMKSASAYIPGHVTGLFEICPAPDYGHMGSRGSGFCIEKGIKTTALVRPFTNGHQSSEVSVFFGPKKVNAPITQAVVQRLLMEREANGYRMGRQHFEIWIQHELDVPIGIGLGASGAGALGTAWSLAKCLGIKKSPTELAKIAHIVEVEHRTGLGDVIAQVHGGFEIRQEPGAPGIGEITILDDVWAQDIVFLSFGDGIETAKVLKNPITANKINQMGSKLLNELMTNFSLESFCKLSQQFAKATGLVTPQVKAMLKRAKRLGVELGSMSMLGNSVFFFVEDSRKILPQLRNGSKEVLITRIPKSAQNGMN